MTTSLRHRRTRRQSQGTRQDCRWQYRLQELGRRERHRVHCQCRHRAHDFLERCELCLEEVDAFLVSISSLHLCICISSLTAFRFFMMIPAN